MTKQTKKTSPAKLNGMRYWNSASVPKRVPAGRVIVHNHVRRHKDQPHGAMGFRVWTEDAPAQRDLVKCKCKWSGLPHYRVRSTKKDFDWTDVEFAEFTAGQDKCL